jgi:hypothetical protein
MVAIIELAASLTGIPLLMVIGVAPWSRRDQCRQHLRQSMVYRQRFLGDD